MRVKQPKALSIYMLGTMDILVDGQSITSTLQQKARAVLAYLAITPGVAHSRHKIAEIFWPNLSRHAARSNLRQVVLLIQRKLTLDESEPIIIANRENLTFNAHANSFLDLSLFLSALPQCDKIKDPSPACGSCLHDLESMASAYGGEFLEGLVIENAPEFDDWLRVQRESLRRRAVFILEQLVECHNNQGQNKNAVHFALRLCDIDPWNEEAQRRTMLLLAASGQRATAIGHYEALRKSLHHELGVMPEDETRQLAERIQSGNLRNTDKISPSALSPASPSIEYRQISVVCIGFTLQSKDIEKSLEQLNEARNFHHSILASYAGHVVRSHDGTLLAYFGYPYPRENTALLAVEAAMKASKSQMNELTAHIGVHTGLVIVGDDPRLPDPLGRVTALTQTLQSSALSNDILISSETHKLVEGYFLAEPTNLISSDLKAFRILAPSGAKNRLQAQSDLTPLFGRKNEIKVLKSSWRDAMTARASAVLLCGDPGIGKSRLVHTLRQNELSPHTRVIELQCAQEYKHSPLQPLLTLLENILGFHSEDTAQHRFQVIVDHLEKAIPNKAKEAIPLLAGLLSLPIIEPYQSSGASPHHQREQILDLLLVYWLDYVAQAPTLLIIEDLHWIDPTSLELIGRLLRNQRQSSYMIIMTARPEFTPPWTENLFLSMTISPLSDDEVRAMILSSDQSLNENVIRQIIRHADGVPLFAEELITCGTTTPEQDFNVPPALRDLLAVRLDALGKTKQIAQTAAVIGRTVSLPLLEKVTGLEKESLDLALRQLEQSGIAQIQSNTTLQFRHALFKDGAYNVLARKDRVAIHRSVAQTIEDRFSKIADSRPELLAQHWTQGEEFEHGVSYWIRAGKLAMRQNAIEEAISHYRSGLDALQQLPQTQSRTDMEFALHVGLGTACYAVEGYASTQGAASFENALALMSDTKGNVETFKALWGLWAGHSSHSDWRASLVLTQRLGVMAPEITDPIFQQQAAFAAGNTQFWRGEFTTAQDHLHQAIALYTPAQNPVHVESFGENGYVTSASYLSWTLHIMGDERAATKASQDALNEAHRIKHPFSLGYALTFATVLQRLKQNPTKAQMLAEKIIALAETYGFPLWLTSGSLMRGWSKVMLGDPQALDEMRAPVKAARALMGGVSVIFLEILADALYHAGQIEECHTVITEALGVAEQMDDRHAEAELHRLKGLCLLSEPFCQQEAALTCFKKAQQIARRQNALLFELRAAISLADQCHRTNQNKQAQDLLTDIVTRLPKGARLPELKQAQALMKRSKAD
ncbi:MAG: AAA family ATPase [Methylocystaceae bacterium]|nr:AAA family ATPase [Methylocystaceae bacterium]